MEKNKLTVKDSCLSFLLGFILCQLGVLVTTCIVLFACKFLRVDSSFLNTCVGYTILSLSLYFIMLLIFAYFNKNKDNKITQKIKFSKLLIYISIAIASFFALYPIVVCVDTLLAKLGFTLNSLSYELTTKNYFISILSLAIAPAICEELLFRGLIFSGLKKHGKILSVTITSLMFCLYHLSISQTVYPMMMGLLLTIIMFYEQNIYYCIAAHFTNNFLSLTFSFNSTTFNSANLDILLEYSLIASRRYFSLMSPIQIKLIFIIIISPK